MDINAIRDRTHRQREEARASGRITDQQAGFEEGKEDFMENAARIFNSPDLGMVPRARYFDPKTGEPDPEKVHDAWQRIDEEQDIRQDREDDSIEREAAARHPTSGQ